MSGTFYQVAFKRRGKDFSPPRHQDTKFLFVSRIANGDTEKFLFVSRIANGDTEKFLFVSRIAYGDTEKNCKGIAFGFSWCLGVLPAIGSADSGTRKRLVVFLFLNEKLLSERQAEGFAKEGHQWPRFPAGLG